MQIPLELKMRCIEATKTASASEVYRSVFLPEHEGMSLDTFKRKLRGWKSKAMADADTLSAGTYQGFTAHGATVQVDGEGNVRQVWVKQTADDQWERLLEAIQGEIEPRRIEPKCVDAEMCMLEVPLFDMHFGVASLADYYEICREIVGLIKSKHWKEINLIVGQDLIHNNDMRGHTARGTPIEAVDIPTAWGDAWDFWGNVIDASLENAENVHLRYSKGNHDECISWCFVKALEARYPQLKVDTALAPRKVIWWEGCFIGYGHCEYTGKLDKLFRDFVIDFPALFAASDVREIHTGHLHTESCDNGFMVRRLASSVPVDEWSSSNGFIGSHKRFQLFEYAPRRLKAIYYV